MKRVLLISFFFFASYKNFAQDVFLKDVLKANREKLYRNLVNKTINAGLSIPLNDSTEEYWQDAFHAMALIQYRSLWTDGKIRSAFTDLEKRSISFQYSLLELIHGNYPGLFLPGVISLLQQTNNEKIFIAAAVYILQTDATREQKDSITWLMDRKNFNENSGELLIQFFLSQVNNNDTVPSIHTFLQKDFLPGKVLLISFQRKNRDLPGLAMVRDTAGNFIKQENGEYFSIPQLARSLNNLPGYLSNGNTPEGIFKMDGFGNSKSSFIGPTTNVQLTIPFEDNEYHFYGDSTLIDTTWDIALYKNLLPANLKNYYPLYQSYYAGKAGRTEIIAHGTAVNPEYYKNAVYYPFTPTLGCLSTKETWSETDGKLIESDEQKLVDAIIKAGGPHGYAIVINMDDKQQPVSLKDILPFLKLAGQN